MTSNSGQALAMTQLEGDGSALQASLADKPKRSMTGISQFPRYLKFGSVCLRS